MNHGSLFSGIGGFDLAATKMGWNNVFHCEINPFARKVLKYYWPKAESYEDITKTDFTIWRGKIDLLTGGFPCQPFSLAGKRLGSEDDRHLWPEMLRAIREIKPRYIVGENVYGFVNWSNGMVFNQVQTDLENEGYEIATVIIPACAKNAPHRRDRIWIVAHAKNIRCEQTKSAGRERREQEPNNWNEVRHSLDANGAGRDASNSLLLRSKRREKPRYFNKSRQETKQQLKGLYKLPKWEEFPTQSPVCSRNDGFSSKLDGITFPKWRNESIKAYGNAIVPQIALQIFKIINHLESKEVEHERD